ncbi:SPOR domain-containing protein [Aliiglaciecola sp. CAU 1673]|uniref:SPOR domain-containing protein n=1 Tax=Aliiglaciecola sp. CAU 1673 TaxID=3032595 RepID=UPI0023D9F76C|nr:SPOR domain-containing protein [Aliiglaciecola sp. CAU 1673]MDF2178058.1 SPOR domain-containing protein [Aliiglaciecola sp. CAU 1673]
MSSAFQNRLVGTVIIVALAVIFLPDVLDGKKVSHKDTFVDVPPRPAAAQIASSKDFPKDEVQQRVNREVEVIDEPAVDESGDLPASTEPEPEMAAADTVSQEEVTPPAPATQSKAQSPSANTVQVAAARPLDYPVEDRPVGEPVSAGWVVQLGSFRHQKNVRELLDKVESAGYRAFTRKVQTSAGELTKVFVGPDLSKDKMEKALPHLNKLTSLQGKVTEFQVQ